MSKPGVYVVDSILNIMKRAWMFSGPSSSLRNTHCFPYGNITTCAPGVRFMMAA